MPENKKRNERENAVGRTTTTTTTAPRCIRLLLPKSAGDDESDDVEKDVVGVSVQCPLNAAKAQSGLLAKLLEGHDDDSLELPETLVKDLGCDGKTLERVVEFWTHHTDHPEDGVQWDAQYPEIRTSKRNFMEVLPLHTRQLFLQMSKEDEQYRGILQLLKAAHYFDSPLLISMSAAFIVTYLRQCELVGGKPRLLVDSTRDSKAMPAGFISSNRSGYYSSTNWQNQYGITYDPETFCDPFLGVLSEHITAHIVDMMAHDLAAAIVLTYTSLLDAIVHVGRLWDAAACAPFHPGQISWSCGATSVYARLMIRNLEQFPNTAPLMINVDELKSAAGEVNQQLQKAISTCKVLSICGVGSLKTLESTMHLNGLLIANLSLEVLFIRTAWFLSNATFVDLLSTRPLKKLVLWGHHEVQLPYEVSELHLNACTFTSLGVFLASIAEWSAASEIYFKQCTFSDTAILDAFVEKCSVGKRLFFSGNKFSQTPPSDSAWVGQKAISSEAWTMVTI